MKKAIVIGIAGGTGSGKTSIAQAILEDLKKAEKRHCYLNKIHIM